jgi:hypothetical protein
MYSYVMLNGSITHVIQGGECWLSKCLAGIIVSTELLLEAGCRRDGGCFMVGVNGLQGCEYVTGCRKWHWAVLYVSHLAGCLVEFLGRCRISQQCS